MIEKFILITGPKHSGKTTAARALGKITHQEALDLDEIVEQKAGKSPRELYKEGPEIFRKAEARALASLLSQSGIVAAGGGLIDNTEAMALLAQCGNVIIIYLDVSPETAWQRILQSSSGGELPPFLNTENPKETHRALHERRAKAYKALATITVSAENRSPEEIATEIIELYLFSNT